MDISRDPSFERHLNAYNVVRLDMTAFRGMGSVADSVTRRIVEDLSREYTFLNPDKYAPYVGFTEAEVEGLAVRSGMDMGELRRWYDGYELPWANPKTDEEELLRCYAPFSVSEACYRHRVGPYWTSSEAFRSLLFYAALDFGGLQQDIVQAMGGAEVSVDVGIFENDIHELASRDDALTLLCHLGYLAYDARTGRARVPNEEVRDELRRAIRESRHTEVARIVRESAALLESTWDLDEEAVAQALAFAHDNGCAHAFYNNEQALRAVVRAAYVAADHYAEVQELPSGRGVADIAYIPRRGDPAPALLVKLKWNRKPSDALDQIIQRDYAAALRAWGGPVLLVGVTYDPKTREHGCAIEELDGRWWDVPQPS